jgi:hypothetical protein
MGLNWLIRRLDRLGRGAFVVVFDVDGTEAVAGFRVSESGRRKEGRLMILLPQV